MADWKYWTGTSMTEWSIYEPIGREKHVDAANVRPARRTRVARPAKPGDAGRRPIRGTPHRSRETASACLDPTTRLNSSGTALGCLLRFRCGARMTATAGEWWWRGQTTSTTRR